MEKELENFQCMLSELSIFNTCMDKELECRKECTHGKDAWLDAWLDVLGVDAPYTRRPAGATMYYKAKHKTKHARERPTM